ncbi:unnamed protein product, partial [Closterium sp. NIES-53]
DLEIVGEPLLIDIGLTSMNGMEVLELLERRCDRRLVVDDMERLTIGHLRQLDQGIPLPDTFESDDEDEVESQNPEAIV